MASPDADTPHHGGHAPCRSFSPTAARPDEAARSKLRDVYANDAAMLLQAGQTVAVEFAMIAAANRYWWQDG